MAHYNSTHRYSEGEGTMKSGTYHDLKSKTAIACRENDETRRIHCYRCGKSFISYQFEVRKCDACRQLSDPLRFKEIYFNMKEKRNIEINYRRIMKQFGHNVCNIMGDII